MPLRYKIGVLKALKDKGYNTNRLRQEKILSESTIQKLRTGQGISWDNLERLCSLLGMQPGDILEFVEKDIFAEIGFTEWEMPEITKLIQFVPDGKESKILPFLLELIRTDDWYDLSDNERFSRANEVIRTLTQENSPEYK